jgi:hypothetical protein
MVVPSPVNDARDIPFVVDVDILQIKGVGIETQEWLEEFILDKVGDLSMEVSKVNVGAHGPEDIGCRGVESEDVFGETHQVCPRIMIRTIPIETLAPSSFANAIVRGIQLS